MQSKTVYEFPWRAAVQLAIEAGGIVIAFMMLGIEGASSAGMFLIGVHAIFIIFVLYGFILHYNEYSRNITPELKIIFAAMYAYSLAATGIYFYFIVKVSDPNVFDIVLTTWGLLTLIILFFHIFRLVWFTNYAYITYAEIIGNITEEQESEVVKTEEKVQEKPSVPLYLLDFEKMFGKK